MADVRKRLAQAEGSEINSSFAVHEVSPSAMLHEGLEIEDQQ